MFRAVEKVAERRQRAVNALTSAGIAYAVAGGHAVAAWVARVDESATRTTPDVDLLVNRGDLDQITLTLESAGFVHEIAKGAHVFVDGPEGKIRDGIHLIFSGEWHSNANVTPAPATSDSEPTTMFQLVKFDALVGMKLNAFRLKDQVHLLDMLEVGLIDATWPARLPPILAERLQELIDNPE